MLPRSLLPLAALAMIAAASPARAQDAYCMPGAPPAACFTIDLLARDADAGALFPTFMTFRVRNLQGSINSDPSPFGITFFGVTRTATPPTAEHPDGTDFLLMTELQPLTSVQGPVEWNPEPLSPFISESTADPDVRFFVSDGNGIGGCASTTAFPSGTVARTCAVQGLTGAVDVSFFVGIFDVTTFATRTVSLDDVSISIGGRIGEDRFSCRFNGAASGAPAGTTCLSVPYTAVPEPGTLALLAAPALALMRRRRRSR